MAEIKIEKPKQTIKDPEEFNSLIESCKRFGIRYKITAYLTSIHLMIFTEKIQHFDFSLTGSSKDIINIGAIANSIKNCNYPKEIWNDEIQIASGYQFSDDYFAKKELKCRSYDINSAFPFAMLKPMPDTTKKPRRNDYLKAGEIGFLKSGSCTTKPGYYANYIFPLIDSPFKEFVYKYYKNKKEAITKEEKAKAKAFLNIATGLFAKKGGKCSNIYIRNAIIYYSNQYIKKYIDENTVYCNIDCIVSLTPRPDLPIGPEIGQFKCEHECQGFKYIKNCEYQWKNDDGTNDCHYSGIPAGTLKDIEDLNSWEENLKYYLGKDELIHERKKNN